MLDDVDMSATNLPDPERVYRNYLETCRRLGVTPVSRDHAHGLMAEWFDVLGRAMTTPKPTKH